MRKRLKGRTQVGKGVLERRGTVRAGNCNPNSPNQVQGVEPPLRTFINREIYVGYTMDELGKLRPAARQQWWTLSKSRSHVNSVSSVKHWRPLGLHAQWSVQQVRGGTVGQDGRPQVGTR